MILAPKPPIPQIDNNTKSKRKEGISIKSIVEEIYFGNISPNEESFGRSPDLGEAIKTAAHNEDILLEILDKREKSMLVDLVNAQAEINGITAVENFSYGFKLGVMLGVMLGIELFSDEDAAFL